MAIASRLAAPINCHCGQCRRLSGAAFSTWLTAPSDACTFPELSLLTAYQASEHCTRHFCKVCGGHLFTRDARMPEHVGFPAGAFPDAEVPAIRAEYFTDDKAPWCKAVQAGAAQHGGISGYEAIER